MKVNHEVATQTPHKTSVRAKKKTLTKIFCGTPCSYTEISLNIKFYNIKVSPIENPILSDMIISSVYGKIGLCVNNRSFLDFGMKHETYISNFFVCCAFLDVNNLC